jgi:hypothetical protein
MFLGCHRTFMCNLARNGGAIHQLRIFCNLKLLWPPPGRLWSTPVSLWVQRSLMVGSLFNSSLLLIPNHIPISLRLMEGERRTKHRNDGGRPNKRGKVVSSRSRVSSSYVPPPLQGAPPSSRCSRASWACVGALGIVRMSHS